jgi:hypothetical protein
MENAETARTLTNSAKDKKLKTLCLEIFKVRLEEQQAKQRYAELQSTFQALIKKSGDRGLQFPYKGKNYKIINVEPIKITWDIKKLFERFNELKKCDVLNEVVEVKVNLNDVAGFKKFLKEKDIKWNEIKPFLNIEKKVNQKKMDELSQLGAITEDDIKGCYTVGEGTSYIKPTESEIREDE